VLTLQVILSGVLLGGLYACMAIGFSIIWGVTNLINLAHGSMIIISASHICAKGRTRMNVLSIQCLSTQCF